MGSIEVDSFCASASIASGVDPIDAVAGGRTYGTLLEDRSKSMTTVFRSLRTRWVTGCASAIRTRDAGAPSDSAASIATDAIGLLALAATELATPSAPTLRKSSSRVSGSGRDATYDTGSLASMTSEAPLPLTFALMVVSRTEGTAGFGLSGRSDAWSSAPAGMNRRPPLTTGVARVEAPAPNRFVHAPPRLLMFCVFT